MYEDLILQRSVAELQQAAAGGIVYYSCERFEDAYGRLVVGVGARLEGRALEHVTRSGRETVYASRVALPDGALFQMGLQRAVKRGTKSGQGDKETGRQGEKADRDIRPFFPLSPCSPVPLSVLSGAPAPLQRALGEALQVVYAVCPDAVRLIEKLSPSPRDLIHGVQVAMYARRLMETFNRARGDGLVSARYPYSASVRDEVFLSGAVHDIGRWKGRPVKGHEAYGVQLLRRRLDRSPLLHALVGVVAQHHRPLKALSGGPWEVHKAVPVVLAEAVVEFPGSPGGAVYRLCSGDVPENAEGMLICLCNQEGVAPPRTVVRIGKGKGAELAIGLRAPEGDCFGSYLLRFARIDAEGGLKSLFSAEATDEEILPYLTIPEGPDRTVVSLLPKAICEKRFSRYERLIPAIRERLLHRSRERKPGQSQEVQDA